MSDRRLSSLDDVNMYILSPIRDSQCLTELGVKRTLHFGTFAYKRFSTSERTVIARQVTLSDLTAFIGKYI